MGGQLTYSEGREHFIWRVESVVFLEAEVLFFKDPD